MNGIKNKATLYLLLGGLVITIIGWATGWYLFIFLIIPLGLYRNFTKEKKE